MNQTDRVAVCSRSFSRNAVLREELLQKYANVTFNSEGLELAGDSLIEFVRGHNKVIVGLERLDAAILARMPDVEVFAKYGVGLDKIDLEAMRQFNKRLGWEPGVNRRSAAELALGFAIMMFRRATELNRAVLDGVWEQRPGRLLTGKTIGIIGCGNIGKDLTLLLQPFGCKILVHDIVDYAEFYQRYNLTPVDLETLLREADLVTIHTPLDASTRNLLSAERLALMKPTAILLNAARGGLVDEAALKLALQENRLAGAAFDVFVDEPPTDMELVRLPNFFATPHIGGSAAEAIVEMGRSAIRGLDEHKIP